MSLCGDGVGTRGLAELAEQKEKEWRDVNDRRIESLEQSVKNSQQTIEQQNGLFKQLQEDFHFNLRLLEERDMELERYDQVVVSFKAALAEKDAETSELKINLDKLRQELKVHDSYASAEKERYQGHVLALEQELEQWKARASQDITAERERFEKFKRDCQLQLDDVADDADRQRRELTSAFEEALQRREHEFRLELDETNARLARGEQQTKTVLRDSQQLQEQKEKMASEMVLMRDRFAALEKALRDKEWDLGDVTSVSSARSDSLLY